jgi:hypothetical protein
MNAPKKTDWEAVEQAIRRSVRGRSTHADSQLVSLAYQREPDVYTELSRRVRAEEQEAHRRSGGVP